MKKNLVHKEIDNSKNLNKQASPKIKWEVKKQLILQEIAKGSTYADICNKFKDEWNCTYNTMQNYIKEASNELYNEDVKETMKQINLMRLDSAYAESIKDGDKKTAIKAIDIQNKMLGAYEQKVQLDTNRDIDVTFNF